MFGRYIVDLPPSGGSWHLTWLTLLPTPIAKTVIPASLAASASGTVLPLSTVDSPSVITMAMFGASGRSPAFTWIRGQFTNMVLYVSYTECQKWCKIFRSGGGGINHG